MDLLVYCKIAFGLVAAGVGIGFGIALGFEMVMRASGDGRAVILTWARTTHSSKKGRMMRNDIIERMYRLLSRVGPWSNIGIAAGEIITQQRILDKLAAIRKPSE